MLSLWQRQSRFLEKAARSQLLGLSAQATSGIGILLSVFGKLSYFKVIQIERDCSFLKGGEEGRSTGLLSFMSQKKMTWLKDASKLRKVHLSVSRDGHTKM